MVHLLQLKTADTAHTGNFVSATMPLFPIFGVGHGDEANKLRTSAITTSQYGCVATIEILLTKNYKQIRIGLLCYAGDLSKFPLRASEADTRMQCDVGITYPFVILTL